MSTRLCNGAGLLLGTENWVNLFLTTFNPFELFHQMILQTRGSIPPIVTQG